MNTVQNYLAKLDRRQKLIMFLLGIVAVIAIAVGIALCFKKVREEIKKLVKREKDAIDRLNLTARAKRLLRRAKAEADVECCDCGEECGDECECSCHDDSFDDEDLLEEIEDVIDYQED